MLTFRYNNNDYDGSKFWIFSRGKQRGSFKDRDSALTEGQRISIQDPNSHFLVLSRDFSVVYCQGTRVFTNAPTLLFPKKGEFSSIKKQRIGTAEREATAEAISAHYSAGRLDDDELNDRIPRIWSAKYDLDLTVLLEDLPGSKLLPDIAVKSDTQHSTAFFAASLTMLVIAVVLFVLMFFI